MREGWVVLEMASLDCCFINQEEAHLVCQDMVVSTGWRNAFRNIVADPGSRSSRRVRLLDCLRRAIKGVEQCLECKTG